MKPIGNRNQKPKPERNTGYRGVVLTSRSSPPGIPNALTKASQISGASSGIF